MIKEPKIDNKSSFSFFTSIWIVPFIALIIGGWLVYEHFSKLGPKIRIEFIKSNGLIAGSSVIKYRDVSIGKVTSIEINNEKDGVVVYARVNKDAEKFLNETTKFWIVKPEVDYTGVKGLDTILSGTYISMSAKNGTDRVREFNGLASEYVEIGDDVYYAIESTFYSSIKKSTPIYFKGQQVGEVVTINLDTESKNIIAMAKIYKNYASLVNSTTKFWVQSALDMKLNDNRLEFNVAPLQTLVLGGISFDTAFDIDYKQDYSKIYRLYRSATDARNIRVGLSRPEIKRFIFEFQGDVSSLDSDTEIKYKGFKVGEVKELNILYSKKLRNFEAKCIGEIDFANFSTKDGDGFDNFKDLAKKGLVAKLIKSNFLLNRSTIILTENNETFVGLIKDKRYNAYIFPTKDLEKSNLIATLNSIAYKLKKIDYDKAINNINSIIDNTKEPIKNLNSILKNANKTVLSINKVVSNKSFQNISGNLNKTIVEFNKTLKDLKGLLNGYSSNSLFGDKLDATLKELHNTTDATNRLIHKLNKKPNSLIFGD